MNINNNRGGEVVYNIFGIRGTILTMIDDVYFVKWDDGEISTYEFDEYNVYFGDKNILRKLKLKDLLEDDD